MDLGARPSGRILPMLTVKSEEKQTTSRDVSRNSANILAKFFDATVNKHSFRKIFQNLIYLHDNEMIDTKNDKMFAIVK